MAIGEIEQSYCRRCEVCSDHRVVFESVRSSPSDFPGEGWFDESKALECQGCRTLTIAERHATEMDQAYGPSDPFDDGWRLVPRPKQDHHSKNSTLLPHLPLAVQRVYEETVTAIENDLRVLAAAGVRALIEGTCADLKIEGGMVPCLDKDRKPVREADGTPRLQFRKNLEGKINGLAHAGIITMGNAAHLHGLRTAGNEGLHELDAPPIEELKLAMRLAEHLLTQVFQIDSDARSLSSMRQFRKGQQPPPMPPIAQPPALTAQSPAPVVAQPPSAAGP